MAEEVTAAVKTTLSYYRAWTGHDLEKALRFVADDIVCDTPSHGHLEGLDAFRKFMEHFVFESLKSSELRVALGNEDTVLLWYDILHLRGSVVPVAERVTLRGGKIVQTMFVFDRLPFFDTVASFSSFLNKARIGDAHR